MGGGRFAGFALAGIGTLGAIATGPRGDGGDGGGDTDSGSDGGGDGGGK
jgi:hypothetical protein